MRTVRRIGVALTVAMVMAVAALAVGSGAGHAADAQQQSADPAADQGLLEYLGSVDPSSDSTEPDDGSWLAYLSQVNPGKAAKASQVPAQTPAQPKPASSVAGGDKPDG